MKFSETQLKAIRHGEHPMLVIAGPGSGKTTVLTNRVKYLIEEHGVNPSEILVITFTKAAAVEMQNRFINLVGKRLPVTFGTFHAVYFNILKAAYNYSVDNILKDDRKIQIIRQAAEKAGVVSEDMNELADNLAGEISKVKSDGQSISDYHSVNCDDEKFRKIYDSYCKIVKNYGLIDFDDMLIYCYELFTERKDILEKWQAKYRYILIDEFQDINRIQYEVIRMLAKPEDNLFIVGDDDQSIYGFRGSNPGIMLNFDRDYPGAQKVILDTNYRSTGNIVKAAGTLIGRNKTRFKKNINTSNPPGNKVDIVEFNSTFEEYRRVVNVIKEMEAAGHSYSECAVLYRSNAVVAPLVRTLVENNIPFTVKGTVPNIFDHWIAKDILTYMAVARGSRRRSDFLRIMNKPLRYIGRDYLSETSVSFDELEKYYEGQNWMIERLDKFQNDLAMMSEMSPYAMINYLRKGVGYDDYLATYADEHNLERRDLFDIADEIMESTRTCNTCEKWYDYIDKHTKRLKDGFRSDAQAHDAINLMTMHGSKGLEYDTVIIVDANEGITPHNKALTDADIEEERRMFYVAMTRAKNMLKIFYSKERYNRQTETSRFVLEVMDEVVG